MAKVYGPTKELKASMVFNHSEDWKTQMERQHKALREIEKKYETIKFGVADGYAIYAVLSMKPLTLMHIPYMDGYHADPILLRGLKASDVEKRLLGEKKMKEFFSKAKMVEKEEEEQNIALKKAEEEAAKQVMVATKLVTMPKPLKGVIVAKKQYEGLSPAQKAWVTIKAKKAAAAAAALAAK
jgi:hypothetical protein